jgi:hypothetical protein
MTPIIYLAISPVALCFSLRERIARQFVCTAKQLPLISELSYLHSLHSFNGVYENNTTGNSLFEKYLKELDSLAKYSISKTGNLEQGTNYKLLDYLHFKTLLFEWNRDKNSWDDRYVTIPTSDSMMEFLEITSSLQATLLLSGFNNTLSVVRETRGESIRMSIQSSCLTTSRGNGSDTVNYPLFQFDAAVLYKILSSLKTKKHKYIRFRVVRNIAEFSDRLSFIIYRLPEASPLPC